MAFCATRVEAIEVFHAEIGVGLASTQDVVHSGENAVRDGDGRLVPSSPPGDSVEMRVEVAWFTPTRVGTTRWMHGSTPPTTVHPHARGDDTEFWHLLNTADELETLEVFDEVCRVSEDVDHKALFVVRAVREHTRTVAEAPLDLAPQSLTHHA